MKSFEEKKNIKRKDKFNVQNGKQNENAMGDIAKISLQRGCVVSRLSFSVVLEKAIKEVKNK